MAVSDELQEVTSPVVEPSTDEMERAAEEKNNTINDSDIGAEEKDGKGSAEEAAQNYSEHAETPSDQNQGNRFSLLKQLSERLSLSGSTHQREKHGDGDDKASSSLESEKNFLMERLKDSLSRLDPLWVESLQAEQNEQAYFIEEAAQRSQRQLPVSAGGLQSNSEFDLEFTTEQDNNNDHSKEKAENAAPLDLDGISSDATAMEGVHSTVAADGDTPIFKNEVRGLKLAESKGMNQDKRELISAGSSHQPHQHLESEKKRQSQLLREKLRELQLEDLELELDRQQEEQSKLVLQAMEASASNLSTELKEEGEKSQRSLLEAVGGWLTGSSHHTSKTLEETSKQDANDSVGEKDLNNSKRQSSLFDWFSGSSHHIDSSNDDPKRGEQESKEIATMKTAEEEKTEPVTVETERNSEGLRQKLKALMDKSSANELGEKLMTMLVSGEMLDYTAKPAVVSLNGPTWSLDLPIESESYKILKTILVENSKKKATNRNPAARNIAPPVSPKAAARDARRARVLDIVHSLDQALEAAGNRKTALITRV